MRKRYEDTPVSPDKTRREIREALKRAGVEEFGYLERPTGGVLLFVYQGRQITVTILPQPQGTKAKQEQEERRIWRVARHWIINQIEAIESGLLSFEEAFFAQTMTSGGATAYEYAAQNPTALPIRRGRAFLPGGVRIEELKEP